MEIFFSAGEPSGDQHAAQLIRELKQRSPKVRLSGYGGPLMQQAGCRLQYPLTELAVMGFFTMFPLLLRFARLIFQAGRYFREHRPDAVVLVDFPGFNFWIARKAKAAGIPVFYYLPPQLWAWAPWRIRRIRKYVDYILSGLPFEEKWYAERGVAVEYVGHPFFDHVAEAPLDEEFCARWRGTAGRIVGILPGSRKHEVKYNWPLMLKIIRRLSRKHPEVRFLAACYNETQRAMCVEMLERSGYDLPIDFFVGKTPEIIELAECCLMVSGSVSLELLARQTPAVVIYRCGRVLYPFLRLLVRLDSITLPNLIAGEKLYPEWVVVYAPRRDVRQMTAVLDGWLSDPRKLRGARNRLAELHGRYGLSGAAAARTAGAILNRLSPPVSCRAA